MRDIREQCLAASVPLFFKQYGHVRNNPDRGDPTAKRNGGSAKGGRMLDGRVWDEMPAAVDSLLVFADSSIGRPAYSFYTPII